jgi:hypothetical protein
MSQCCHIDETRAAVFLDAPVFVKKKKREQKSLLRYTGRHLGLVLYDSQPE